MGGGTPLERYVEFDIAGLGTVVVDHQVILEQYPEPDSKNEIQTDWFQVGGPVPTALAVLARFGRRTTFLGHWGDDPFGAMIEADFQDEGIGFSGSCCRTGLRSGFAHAWIDARTGQRTIACSRAESPLSVEEVDEQLLARCGAIHLDGWPSEAAHYAARIVQKNGGTVFLDSGSPKPSMEQLLPLVDVLNCPRRFLTQFLGHDDIPRGGRELLARGPRMVTITDGDQGAMLFTGAEQLTQPAFPVTAVDTTGAGDVFSGAIVHATLAGWPADRTLKFAAATAALKCAKLGNREALPGLDEVLRMIEAES
ncbi:Ribokinase [Symmachiella macrocystis]|uniref:Ribokinase n=1 Tax=Symmachiella macrocystis TaxID=2527985 RepID=A0A5C6BBR4_9PLAN|nr:Ribokinase [Symmachiella macrocystis]